MYWGIIHIDMNVHIYKSVLIYHGEPHPSQILVDLNLKLWIRKWHKFSTKNIFSVVINHTNLDLLSNLMKFLQ